MILSRLPSRALNDVEPIPPSPNTTTLAPRRDLGGVTTAPTPVSRRSRLAALVDGASSRILATAISGSTVKFEKVEHPCSGRSACPVAKARGAVRHQPLALGGADRGGRDWFSGSGSFLHLRHSGV